MILPTLNGKLTCDDFFIYTACDQNYFDEFAPSLINSIKKNTDHQIHVHIFNPRDDQLEFCLSKDVSCTYEYVDIGEFKKSADRLAEETQDDPINRKLRTLTAMEKGNDRSIQERIMKTYYACSRFIRLSQLVDGQRFFSMDVDAVVRSPLKIISGKDFFLHHISGKKARFLAGGIMGSATSKNFLDEYSKELEKYITEDRLYWGLDQDILDAIVPKFNWGQLPLDYIDWNMTSKSYVWTAKGTRKNLVIFIDEQKKYSSL